MPVDAISLEVFKNMFISVSEEMGVALQRTSYSTNMKERQDFSCALFNPAGEMVAQAAHQPVHLGAMPASVQAALQTFPEGLQPGDIIILNDPYLGGSHLPDITLVAPRTHVPRQITTTMARNSSATSATAATTPTSAAWPPVPCPCPPSSTRRG